MEGQQTWQQLLNSKYLSDMNHLGILASWHLGILASWHLGILASTQTQIFESATLNVWEIRSRKSESGSR